VSKTLQRSFGKVKAPRGLDLCKNMPYISFRISMRQKLPLDDEVVALINKVLDLEKFFPGLKKADWEAALVDSGVYLYPKNARIIKQGDEGRDVYIIHKGKVAVIHRVG